MGCNSSSSVGEVSVLLSDAIPTVVLVSWPADDAANYHRRERRHGEFVRTISLPFAVDPSRVEAQMTQGVLYVILHRPPEDQPRRIKVRAG